MSKVRGKDTKPELALRKALSARGARYRIHTTSLPGRPDLSNASKRVAVFVDGCFWHGCPRHFRLPKTRRAFWEEKIRRNKEKREQVRAAYSPDWHVFEIFECDLISDLEEHSSAVALLLL